MKKVSMFVACAALSISVAAQCQNPFGWTRVGERSLGVSEKVCIYEKNGVQMSIVVSGFCPMSPCY
jgi:hypothetical protein